MLKENQIAEILYTKDVDGKQEVTDRFIVPTTIPKSNIKAIDVTSLEESDRKKLAELHKEYQKYFKLQMKAIFSFEDWLEHTGEKVKEVKHRTFKIDNIQIVK